MVIQENQPKIPYRCFERRSDKNLAEVNLLLKLAFIQKSGSKLRSWWSWLVL